MGKKTQNSMTIFGKTFPGYAFIIGVVLVVGVGFIGYNQYLDHQDRQKFAEIEETVDTLVDRINEEFGTEVVADNSRCYESSQKFKKGPTICKYSAVFDSNILKFAPFTAFVESQNDTVAGYSHFNNTYTDFWTHSKEFSCSLSQEGELFLLECSDYARMNHYSFSD